MNPRFAHIRSWIFDLDNCLYPASTGLFSLIDVRMGAYIQRLLGCDPEEARRVQKLHFHASGTTLAGLMREHDVDPWHFMEDVHDIPLDLLSEDERLASALLRLPGKRFVFTNANAPYAQRVLDRIGIGQHFDGLHDIHDSSHRPKPDPHAYEVLCDKHGIDPATAVFFEDMAQNLAPAKAIGMTTVWVDNGSERGSHNVDPAAIDFTTHDVGAFIDDIILGTEQ
jgi:putative hydrolase of the HAD superfamily